MLVYQRVIDSWIYNWNLNSINACNGEYPYKKHKIPWKFLHSWDFPATSTETVLRESVGNIGDCPLVHDFRNLSDRWWTKRLQDWYTYSELELYGGFRENRGTSKSSNLIGCSRIFHYKQSILGYLHLWNLPYFFSWMSSFTSDSSSSFWIFLPLARWCPIII